jgi:hypothetical protein
MFPQTEKTAKISGYVPETQLANRQWKWVSILFPRAMSRQWYCCPKDRGEDEKWQNSLE